MRLPTSLLSVVLFAMLGAGSLAHAQSVGLRGTVTDAQDRPVSSVNVILKRADGGGRVAGTSTNIDGTFQIENVSPGTYQLEASAIGYAKASRTLTLDAGEERRISL